MPTKFAAVGPFHRMTSKFVSGTTARSYSSRNLLAPSWWSSPVCSFTTTAEKSLAKAVATSPAGSLELWLKTFTSELAGERCLQATTKYDIPESRAHSFQIYHAMSFCEGVATQDCRPQPMNGIPSPTTGKRLRLRSQGVIKPWPRRHDSDRIRVRFHLARLVSGHARRGASLK